MRLACLNHIYDRNYNRVGVIITRYLKPYFDWEKEFLADSYAMGIIVRKGVIVKEDGVEVNKKLVDVYSDIWRIPLMKVKKKNKKKQLRRIFL